MEDCKIAVNPLTLTVAPSPTMGIKLVADQMKQKGITVYDFGVGEMNPEIPLPVPFYNGLINALEQKHTHYCPSSGDLALRNAIAEDLQNNFDLQYSAAHIVITPGPKDALFRAALSVMDPFSSKNRVVCFAPVYESFTAAPYLITGKNAFVLPTDKDFIPDFDILSETLKKHHEEIALIIVNSPNNPSGTVYSKEVLQKLADIIKQYPDIAVISDEVYRTIRYDNEKPFSIASLLPSQTLLVGGISKEVSGTGLRIGFVAAPLKIAKAVEVFVGHFTACVNLPVQKAYATFLQEDKDMKMRNQIRDTLKAKRDLLIEQVKKLPGLKDLVWKEPQGAFYFFPNIEKYLGKKTASGRVLKTDEDLALYILEEGHVVTLPGSKFEKAGYLRIAYASSKNEVIVKGFEELSNALAKLQ